MAGLALLLLSGGASLGQDDDDSHLPGLVADYHDGAGRALTRVEPHAGLTGDAALADRFPRDPFRARWRGVLLVSSAGPYRFAASGNAALELRIADQAALTARGGGAAWEEGPALPLAAGPLEFQVAVARATGDSRFALFWTGPGFDWEPLPPRYLQHLREQTVPARGPDGAALARTLRCARCHGATSAAPTGPALDRLAGRLHRDWLVERLQAAPAGERTERAMPHFAMTRAQAEAIAAWLLQPRPPAEPATKAPSAAGGKPAAAASGETLLLTVGCLACHTWRGLGVGGAFGGGDLTAIAAKRPSSFFEPWLREPASLNRDQRMPVVPLADAERRALAGFLASQGARPASPAAPPPTADQREQGRALAERFRCAACHRLPDDAAAPPALTALTDRSDWARACPGPARPDSAAPGYRLSAQEAGALRGYFAAVAGRAATPTGPNARLLLAEHRCFACHAREGARPGPPLAPAPWTEMLGAVARRRADLAVLTPALTAPSLNQVGDKLTDAALLGALRRDGAAHRPYLHLRMPRFALADAEAQALVRHFVAVDRVQRPSSARAAPLTPARRDRFTLAGGRLLSSDGFGCTSCHAVGRWQPSAAPINARGPSLSMLGQRIRKPWFERFLRNPIRLIPQLEMPSLQLPVKGTLDDRLDDQLAAVWQVLNEPGFEPPAGDALRVLRHTGHDPAAAPFVVTDLLRDGGATRTKPFLIGLANRHGVLLDLEHAALARWTIGDLARQRTEGKSWFWEPGGATVLDSGQTGPDLVLTSGGRDWTARRRGQFLTEADSWQTRGAALSVTYRLTFAPAEGSAPPATIAVERRFAPLPGSATPAASSGFAQEITASAAPAGARVRWRPLAANLLAKARRAADGRALELPDRFGSRIVLARPDAARFQDDGSVELPTGAALVVHYQSAIPVDRLPAPPRLPDTPRRPEPIEIAPGFRGERLPLRPDILPTGLTWRPDGTLVFCSLTGQVLAAHDSDGDGCEDRLTVLADGLAAPFGVHAGADHVDVSTKFALLRLRETPGQGPSVQTIASGWGYSADYHDWAVGLPRNERGEYYLGIPCQQDQRPREAARLHGSVLRLTPRVPDAEDPRLYRLTPITTGHRFPMGLALDRAGELFATDNQGNFKPFNELNHVRPGAYFGFPNAVERGQPAPARTPPAIEIPHPWTRSVNGICFLHTPAALRQRLGRSVFGPLEGHLVGCEYDTRQLVRLTLQKVGDTYQGAVYPLSVPAADAGRGLLGPLVCAVSPRGELMVGNLRESGWGAGNNFGELTRVRVEPEALPCGLAEIRATRDGFTLDFLQPVDRDRAARADSYAIRSYRRAVTPAYGSPDLEARQEKALDVQVAADGRRVTLRLAALRAGFVYEFKLAKLTPGGGLFHPAEGHYTLRVRP